jgi:hypothetical protein
VKHLAAGRPVVLFILMAFAIYLPKALWPTSALAVHVLTVDRLRILGAFAKLVCVGLSAFFCFRSAARFEPGNPARSPWRLLGAWLSLYALGQLLIAAYACRVLPEPTGATAADAAFLAGFFPLFAGEIRFIVVYRSSGFPMGSAREHLLIAACAAVALGAICYAVIAPPVQPEEPVVDRVVYLAYPVLDLAALVPTVVMMRIAFAFRPGRVWAVWACLLAGIACMTIGDTVSAFLSASSTEDAYVPWIHLAWLLAYLFIVWGAKLQHELVSAPLR